MPENIGADYYAFLLRLWRENGETHWRGSLENPHTGERRGFANLNRLVEFLTTQTGGQLFEPDDSNGYCIHTPTTRRS